MQISAVSVETSVQAAPHRTLRGRDLNPRAVTIAKASAVACTIHRTRVESRIPLGALRHWVRSETSGQTHRGNSPYRTGHSHDHLKYQDLPSASSSHLLAK